MDAVVVVVAVVIVVLVVAVVWGLSGTVFVLAFNLESVYGPKGILTP